VDKFDETSSVKIVAAKQNSIIAIPCDEVHKECCILTPNDTKSADKMKPISMHRSTVSPSETKGQNIGTDGTFNESREMDRDTIENYEFDDNHECSAHASGMLRSSKLFNNHSMDDNNVRGRSTNNEKSETKRKRGRKPRSECSDKDTLLPVTKKCKAKDTGDLDGIWFQHYYQLIQFGAVHGHLQVDKDYVLNDEEGKPMYLGKWLRTQRTAYLRYIGEEKKEMLTQLIQHETYRLWNENVSTVTKQLQQPLPPLLVPPPQLDSSQHHHGSANRSSSATIKPTMEVIPKSILPFHGGPGRTSRGIEESDDEYNDSGDEEDAEDDNEKEKHMDKPRKQDRQPKKTVVTHKSLSKQIVKEQFQPDGSAARVVSQSSSSNKYDRPRPQLMTIGWEDSSTEKKFVSITNGPHNPNPKKLLMKSMLPIKASSFKAVDMTMERPHPHSMSKLSISDAG